MTGGEKLLIAGVAGLGIVAILRFRNASATQVSPPVSGPMNLNPHFDMSGIAAAGPFGAPLAVLQPVVSGGINKLNSAIGGANPYAGLKRNADGTYTDGTGAKITFNADGTITRKAQSWTSTNGGKLIVGTANVAKSIYNNVVSIF
jgi:hypothetical protein